MRIITSWKSWHLGEEHGTQTDSLLTTEAPRSRVSTESYNLDPRGQCLSGDPTGIRAGRFFEGGWFPLISGPAH